MEENNKPKDFFGTFESEEAYKKYQETPYNAYVGTSTVQYKSEELRKEAIIYQEALQRWNMVRLKYSVDDMGDIAGDYEQPHLLESCYCDDCLEMKRRVWQEEKRLEERILSNRMKNGF